MTSESLAFLTGAFVGASLAAFALGLLVLRSFDHASRELPRVPPPEPPPPSTARAQCS